jgi:hypothetical protein
VQQQMAELQIAMHNPLLVQISQSRQHLHVRTNADNRVARIVARKLV